MTLNRNLVAWAGALNAFLAIITVIIGGGIVLMVLAQGSVGTAFSVVLIVGAALAAHGIIAALVQIEENTRRTAEAQAELVTLAKTGNAYLAEMRKGSGGAAATPPVPPSAQPAAPARPPAPPPFDSSKFR